jgi:putative flippase GtrA
MEPTAAAPSKFSLLMALPRLLGEGIRFYRTHGWRASLAAINSRDAHPLIQFLKYGICGAGALLVHTAIFFSLSRWVFPTGAGLEDALRAKHSIINNTIAFLFSNTFVYWLNTLWVFTTGRHSKWVEFLTFTLVNAPGAIAGTAVQYYLTKTLGWPTPMAFAGFVLPNVLVNFICRKFFIFKK